MTDQPAEPRAHWGRLHRRQRTDAAAVQSGQATPEETCAHIFAGPRGDDFLDLLYAMTIDKRCRAGASNEELREHEAQCRLVADLEKLRDQGLAAIAAARKTN